MSLADELITRGWTQERAEDEEGRVCLSGAAAFASSGHSIVHGHGQYSIYMQALQAAIHRNGYLTSVIAFNDASDRTFDEVLRVAKEADEMIDYLKELNASSQSSADRITGES